jgi:hypothetical protein
MTAGTLTDPNGVQDIYCDGIGDIEDLGNGVFRFTLYKLQRSIYDGGSTDMMVSARIVMHVNNGLPASEMAIKAMTAKMPNVVPTKRPTNPAHH